MRLVLLCLRTKSFAGAADADDLPSSSRRNAPVEFEREDAEPRRADHAARSLQMKSSHVHQPITCRERAQSSAQGSQGPRNSISC